MSSRTRKRKRKRKRVPSVSAAVQTENVQPSVANKKSTKPRRTLKRRKTNNTNTNTNKNENNNNKNKNKGNKGKDMLNKGKDMLNKGKDYLKQAMDKWNKAMDECNKVKHKVCPPLFVQSDTDTDMQEIKEIKEIKDKVKVKAVPEASQNTAEGQGETVLEQFDAYIMQCMDAFVPIILIFDRWVLKQKVIDEDRDPTYGDDWARKWTGGYITSELNKCSLDELKKRFKYALIHTSYTHCTHHTSHTQFAYHHIPSTS